MPTASRCFRAYGGLYSEKGHFALVESVPCPTKVRSQFTSWRALGHGENLICFDVFQNLLDAVRPSEFDVFYDGRRAQPEMHALIARRVVATRGSRLVVLGA